MARKTLGAPHREVVWLSRASKTRTEFWSEGSNGKLGIEGSNYPEDADCPSSYSYPMTETNSVRETITKRPVGHRRALVLNLLGFRVVLMRNPAPHAA